MSKRIMRCFFVKKTIRRRYRNSSASYKIGGEQATVHAYSKTAALQLLKKQHMTGYTVIENTTCDPEKLQEGYHCTHKLIYKDPHDSTLLGSILPNSPEWNDRFKEKPKISPLREKLIAKIRQRKDTGDPD